MKTLILAIVLVLFLVGSVLAEDRWTVEPRYPDIFPNDGIMDQGTWINPYELRDQSGRTRGTIQPRYPDVFPNDGVFDAGSYANPYELEWD